MDSTGPKKYEMSGITFELPARYEPIKLIGRGTYGAVISAKHKEADETVAIKKLGKIEDPVDAKRVLREILILKNLQHENVLSLQDVVYVPSEKDVFGDIYLVTDFMETDLNRVVRSKQKLTEEHIQYFVYQILRAFLYIHSAKIIHRDLKPSNILLNESCDVKLCDFGLSRHLSQEKGEDLTEYVVTRFYRAPEIMLSSHEYSKAVDMWSIGCSFAEVMTGKVLFPGENYIQQVNLIIEKRGTPDRETMAMVSNENAKKYITSLEEKQKVNLSEIIPSANKLALDLLDKMLDLNPIRRITVEEALKHPYLEQLHEPEDEPTFEGEVDFTFEYNPKLSLEELEKLIMKEISCYPSFSA